MTLFRDRRSHARNLGNLPKFTEPSNPFGVLQRPTDLLDHAASLVAFALLLASWVVVYVTILPADPMPGHIHRQPPLLASTN